MPGKEPQRKIPGVAWLALIGIVCFAAMFTVMSAHPTAGPTEYTWSQFRAKVQDDKVDQVSIRPGTPVILQGITHDKHVFTVTAPPDASVSAFLDKNDVQYQVEKSHTSTGSWLLLVAVGGFIALLIFLGRSRSGQKGSTGSSTGRLMEAGEVNVTFADVAGCDEVVEELNEIKQFLSEPERFRALGATIPKGVLLFGPPGTGKTLLARAVAGEAGVPFFSISGSDFVEMYVGVGASRVRKLFEQAKQNAPCVVFIDEIDAVGRRRSGHAQGGQEERENTLNQLLVEIDGFAPTDNVIVMAASNRADILDPALTRPGRFDRQVIVDNPDRNGRRAILGVHGKGKPFGKDVELDTVARQTAGFSGADLANLVNEAALLAARRSSPTITPVDIDEATMRVLAGPQKNRLITEQDKRTIAAHEMGHAIVANELAGAEPVHKVTIISRGRALGMMVSLSEDDKVLRTRKELMCQLAVTLGGRVAEEIMFDDITTGAENDLDKVNQMAQAMVLKFGMGEQFALRAFMSEERLTVHSDDLSRRIDAEIDAIVGEAKLMAQTVLLDHRDQLDRMTDVLIERETIDRPEFELLMADPTAVLPPVDGEEQPAAEGELIPIGEVAVADNVRDLADAKAQREAASANAALAGADSVRTRDDEDEDTGTHAWRWHRDAHEGRRHLRPVAEEPPVVGEGTPLAGPELEAGDDSAKAA